jgi:hypothetical protein
VDEGQARVDICVVIAPCPRRHSQPDAVLLESHRGFVVEASLRLGPGPRLAWRLVAAARRSTRLWTWSLCSQKAPTTMAAASIAPLGKSFSRKPLREHGKLPWCLLRRPRCTAPALQLALQVGLVNSVGFSETPSWFGSWGGGWGGFGGGGGARGGGGGGGLRERFFGFLRSEATRLLLKLRAGLIEAAGYCIYSVPQIRYVHGHARDS